MEFSDELTRRVDEAAARYPTKMAAVLPALHLVQREFGWVPVEAQEWIARKLDVPPAHVHGCVSFYTLYRQKPVGRHHIQVCRTLSCMIRGSGEIIGHLEKKLGIEDGGVTPDGRYSLVEVECLGSCGTAPMFQVNDDYHENLTIEKVDALLEGMK
jgi:NADH-quinone oxidoreductase E subunit